MQPTFRQVPPNVPFSRSATVLSAKRSSTIELPEPVPMTARSKCRGAGAGRRSEAEELLTRPSCPYVTAVARESVRERAGARPRVSKDMSPGGRTRSADALCRVKAQSGYHGADPLTNRQRGHHGEHIHPRRPAPRGRDRLRLRGAVRDEGAQGRRR